MTNVLVPRNANRRSAEPTLAVPLGYPSIGVKPDDQVMLVPTLVHRPGRCIGLPVPSSERAADLVLRMDIGSRPASPSVVLSATISNAAGYGGDIADAVQSYFEEMHRVKRLAIDAVVDQIIRFRNAGGKVSEEDFREIVAKRRAAQQILDQSAPPIFRYEIIERAQFDEWARMEATLASLPSGNRRAALESQWRQLQSRFTSNFVNSSVMATRKWAERFARVGNVMLVIEFGANAAEVFMARTQDELNRATAKMAGQAAGIAASALATFVAAAATSKAIAGLAIILGVTPVGWVVVAAGFAAGLAAGFYVPERIEAFSYELIKHRSELNPGLP